MALSTERLNGALSVKSVSRWRASALPTEANEFLKWSRGQWNSWIRDRLEEREKVFSSDPDELVSRYNSERSAAHSYAGRELLELIQNADDAGQGFPKPNKIHIRLTKDAIFVANTGIPFSPEGVKSLILSDNSPKQLQTARTIGYKGLGFRSVLGWSKTVLIDSGELAIGFSRGHSVSWLKDLMKIDERVRKKVESSSDLGLPHPIPTLSVPFVAEGEILNEHLSARSKEMVRELRRLGFDTVICLEFEAPERSYQDVESQARRISPETVLFLKHIGTMSISSSVLRTVWKVRRSPAEVIAHVPKGRKLSWRIFSDIGSIPRNLRSKDQPQLNQFEIKVAIPTGKTKQATGLYVYFPTKIVFPFPLLTHATLELTQNRQHLIQSDVNRWILGRLTRLMATAAEKMADKKDSWKCLRIVTPTGDPDPLLMELGFRESLTREVRKRKVIPVRNERFFAPTKTKRIRGNFNELLKGPLFSDICLQDEDESIRKNLDLLGVATIEYSDLKSRLGKLSRTSISIDTRAKTIQVLLENLLLSHNDPPEFLVEENGETIEVNVRPLLPPEAGGFRLPPWVPQKLVSTALAKRLSDLLGTGSVRELAAKLSVFGVQAYSMGSIISSAVAEGNRRIKAAPTDEPLIRKEVIQVVWDLYSSIEEKDRPNIPDDVKVSLPTRTGKYDLAGQLYLGKLYPGGEISEELYQSLGGPFVATPAELGLSAKPSELARFLIWLGVASLPRAFTGNIQSGEFIEYVINRVSYPANFGDYIVSGKDRISRLRPRLRDVLIVDRLEEVLESAEPHAIVLWAITDQRRINGWRSSGDAQARLAISPPYKQYERLLHDQTVPSYVIWLLEHAKWIPVSNGEKQMPSRCTLARGMAAELSSFVGVPKLTLEYPLFKAAKVERPTLQGALISLGVSLELDDLPWESFYDILYELPSKDPTGKLARSVYRALVTRSDAEPNAESYQKFVEHGTMWGKKEDTESYNSVGSMYYMENQTIPESAARLFPLLDLDKRRGAAKVKKLFGVQPFQASNREIRIKSFEEHALSDELQEDLEALKPYIYALRVEEDTDHSELGPLRKLSVRLCKKATGSIIVEGVERTLELGPGDYLIVDAIAYLTVELDEYQKSPIGDELVADAIGEIISTLLRVDIGDQVARLAACSSERKEAILDKITGGSGHARLARVETLFQTGSSTDEELSAPYVPPQPVSSGSPPAPMFQQPSGLTPTPSIEVGSLKIDEGKPVQVSPSRQVARRVKANVRVLNIGVTRHRQLEPDRAENVALGFEEDKGRFPEKTSHFQGYESYGCDILSFKTESDKQNFNMHPNIALVERFIEVKGSVNGKGEIELEGNELRCAQKHRNKYFLYRVYEGDQIGKFELVETQNPLDIESAAIRRSVKVNPFRSARSVQYEITEEDKPANELEGPLVPTTTTHSPQG